MDLSEMTHVFGPALGESPPALGEAPTTPMAAAPPQPAPTYQQCDECAAPVDADQRYCVSCGAHRRNVNDPAARYLSHATARSHARRGAAPGQRPRRAGGGMRGLGIALLLALIPAVAAVGVLVGRSSNNQDAKLIQALTRNEAARTAGGAATSTVTSTTAASTATAGARAHHAKSRKKSSGNGSSAKSKQAGNSTTQFGTVSQIAGSKPTQAQKQQGAQDAQKVQKSTGKTYVNGQSSLPSQVVVP